MYLRPRFRRVPSYAGIDDACSELLDNLDPELLVPLDLPSDVPFKPRLTEVKVQLFLRAMLKCAPLFGRPYVVKNVLATRGAEDKLQGLAGVWFNRIIFLGTLFPSFTGGTPLREGQSLTQNICSKSVVPASASSRSAKGSPY